MRFLTIKHNNFAAETIIFAGCFILLKIRSQISLQEDRIQKESDFMGEMNFQSLLPKNDVRLGRYETALNFAMEHDEIRNIALSGSYGSGKSSVINTYEKGCKNKKFLHISLADFSKDGQTTNRNDTVKLLEGKILNQLLHQLDPQSIKQSQFRIKTDAVPHQKLVSVIFFTIYIFILFYSIRFDAWQAFAATLPPGPLDISWTACPSARVIAILVCFLMGGVALYHFTQAHDLQRIFKKLDVKGIVGIEIFENTNDSYFDKYLNEVLYLFEQSGADAIVFEDLDRYDVTQIFEKLKEISDLLYQRSQRIASTDKTEKTSAPKFFYLIRDDVFSSSDRSKFFDFIIPVVPVIATDNAHNLIQERFSELGLQNAFELRFLRAVSLYLTDLRLINNIVNEYIIYQDLLGDNNLQRNRNHQLAIIIYKNLFPRDFEQLQRGAGYVYSLFAARETLLANQRAGLEEEAQQIKQRLEQAQQEHLHSIDELNALFLPTSSTIYAINNSSPNAALSRTEFIKNLLAARTTAYHNGRYTESVDINSLRTQMESDSEYQRRKKTIEDQDGRHSRRLKSRLDEIDQELHRLNTQKLSELMTDDDDLWLLKSLSEEKRQKFNYITSSREFDLLKYLIRDGYIDENYSIYISYFYPNSLTIRDKNFLLRLTSHQKPDYSYPLDSPALVLDWIDESYFTLAEIANFSLFNYILEQKNYRLLKIWLESLKRWCDTDESAFDFPISLWRITPSHGYLTYAINSIAPNWFSVWTESELLSESEWHQYAIDALSNCGPKLLQQINQDNWLSSEISNRETFLQIDHPNIEKLTAALRILKVRFRRLAFRAQDMPLVEQVYQENLYELNTRTLELWLSTFYGAPSGEALQKSYTYLLNKPDEPLSRRVEEHFEEYLDVLFGQDGFSFFDTPQAALALLNHPGIDTAHGEVYIHHLCTVLQDLREVNQADLWPALLDENCVAFQWENVVAYYREHCDGTNPLDNHLIDFLQRSDDSINWTWGKLREEMGEDSASVFYQKLIQCTSLSAERYRVILKPIGAHYDVFTVKGLPDEYVEIVIELGIIAVTSEKMDFMRSSYPNQLVNFLLQDRGGKLIKMAENAEIDLKTAELTALLEDKRLADSTAIRLLDLQKETLSIVGKKYSAAVQVKIIGDFFDVGDINWFLLNFDRQNASVKAAFLRCMQEHIEELCEAVEAEEIIPISVYAHALQAITPAEAMKLRQYLPNKQFELACTTNKKPKFPGTEKVRTILEYFKTNGWISSYQLLPSGRYQAFSKQRKPVTAK